MKIALIAAVDRNLLIGNEGGLPWRLPADLKRFKSLTMGKPLVMGRKTFETIGKPLPGRVTIVMTRLSGWQHEGCRTAASLLEAVDLGRALCGELHCEELMIAGGEEVYRQFLPVCDRMYLTAIDGAFTGRHFFPSDFISGADWVISNTERLPADGKNAVSLAFCTLDACPTSAESTGGPAKHISVCDLLRRAGAFAERGRTEADRCSIRTSS